MLSNQIISDFIFPNALMQTHFNENYLESINIPIKHAILIKQALKSDLN